MDALRTQSPGSKVYFTAGGPGAGKSTSTGEDAGNLVFDSTFSSYEKAHAAVKAAVDDGHDVLIRYVYRPLGEAVQNIVGRSIQDGRISEVGGSAERHSQALENVRRIAAEFPDKVAVATIDNTSNGGRPMSPEEFATLRVTPVDEARRTAYAALREEFANNAGQPGYTEELFRHLSGGDGQDESRRSGEGVSDAGFGSAEKGGGEDANDQGNSLGASSTVVPDGVLAHAMREAGKELPKDQREILEAVRGGADKQQIADRMSITVPEVDKKLADANAAMEKAKGAAVAELTEHIIRLRAQRG
ncbi:MAG: zeta toxin family protein [Chthoniobacter sp.]|uniref:zeta toxin family protein n=1 Tax=Chthoniobacter sp. TaxID=2510640 RepID=UPI0032A8BABC